MSNYPTKIPRETDITLVKTVLPRTQVYEPGGPYYVQGISATSYEYNFAKALDFIGMTYYFQVQFNTGRRSSGGFVLDFLLNTTPLQTPVFIDEEYWHKDAERDEWQEDLLTRMKTYNKSRRFIFRDVGTPEAALSTVRMNFL